MASATNILSLTGQSEKGGIFSTNILSLTGQEYNCAVVAILEKILSHKLTNLAQ